MAEALLCDPRELREATLPPVRVAVIDSGIDGSHPDLAGRVCRAYAYHGDDEGGRMVEMPADENNDCYGHGTGVAHVIATHAPNAEIIDYRVLGTGRARGSIAATLCAIRAAVEDEVPVINLSLAAGKKAKGELFEVCEQAYLRGLNVVAAKRNRPLADLGYPAEFSNVISVDRGLAEHLVGYFEEKIIEFRAHGDSVMVAAPGGGYVAQTGSSFATPAVSALTAGLLGRWPALRPFEVKAALKSIGERLQHQGTMEAVANSVHG